MVRELPRLVLNKLSEVYGIDLVDNPRRLEVLLNEYCGFYHQENQAILNAVQGGWVGRILNRANGNHDVSLYEHLSQEMRLYTGMDRNLAFWTISTWAEALENGGYIKKALQLSAPAAPRMKVVEPLPSQQVAVKTTVEKKLPIRVFSEPQKGITRLQEAPFVLREIVRPKAPPKIEKRSLERIPMSYYFRVFERWRRNRVIGHLVDANSQGLMLISDMPIKTNRVFKMKLSFPVRKDIVSVVFDAKSLWNKRDMMDGYFDTGFLLTDISQRDLNRIEAAFNLFGLKLFKD